MFSVRQELKFCKEMQNNASRQNIICRGAEEIVW